MPDDNQAKLHAWLTAAEGRYLANLRVQEVTRALRSLSSAYVERRERGSGRRVLGALDTAGKRAAFALYYAPLHFVAVTHVVHALRAADPAPGSILDFGCGTGAAGSAWALAAGSAATVTGIDRHPWAVSETRWTFSQLGIKGVAKQGDINRLHRYAGECVIAAYTLNELPDDTRDDVEQHLCEHARHGGRVLILEPLARSVAPWWPDTAKRIIGMGGRSDEWKLTVEVPPVVGLLGTAAGLNYRELRFQTLFL